MQQKLTAAERLIVDIDIKPQAPKGREWMADRAITLAKALKGTGVRCLKLESLVRVDYTIIEAIRDVGFQVFADLKLCGTPETLSVDGILLRKYRPEFLSVMCLAGPTAIRALKAELPETKILGVPVLTSQEDKEVRKLLNLSIEEATKRLGQTAVDAEIDGLICGPKQASKLRAKFGQCLFLVTPGIRPEGVIVSKDDQNPDEVMTERRAIEAGADYLVVGRPITQAENPSDAAKKIIESMEVAIRRYWS